MLRCQKYSQKSLRDNRSFADIVLPTNLTERNVKPKVASIAKKQPTVPNNQLRPTVVRSTTGLKKPRLKNRAINIIVTGLITEDDCIALCDIVQEIGLTLIDTFFKI